MTSWLERTKQKIALKTFQKLYKELPSTKEKQELTLRLFKESMESIALTQKGLVFIDPFDIYVDRDGNIYINKGEDYTTLELAHKHTPKEEKATDSIWPNFLT